MRSVLTLLVLAGSVVAVPQSPATVIQNPSSRLRTWEVGAGRAPLVLLHGYGSSAEQWLPFTQTIHIPASRRFVFPEAPETSPDGPSGGRVWWRLDLASYRAPGNGLPDLSHARPAGLGRSVETMQRLLSDLQRRLGYRQDDLILGGFSQGAMIAADVGFRTQTPMKALVLLSGTVVDEPSWNASMRTRRGLPVFISHGRRDNILPFAISQRLQQTMRDAGLQVTWVPFEGGHEMPMEVVDALNAFLTRLDERRH
jgi:phospholipase/carboxylesterase